MGFIVPSEGRRLAQRMLLGQWTGTSAGVTLRPPEYIGSGTGTAATADGNTALDNEVGTRISSSNSEPSTTIHQGTGQITYTASLAIWEAGWFTSTAAYPSSTMYARGTLASSVDVQNNDKVTWTFQVQYNQG